MAEQTTISQALEESGFPPVVLGAYPFVVYEAKAVRKVVRVETTLGTLALKKFKLTDAELNYSLAAMRHVKQQGFNVPGILPTLDGSLYVTIDEMKYFVMDWLAGRESKYSHVYDLALAARGLADFHHATRGFTPPHSPGKEQWGSWTGHFLERIEEMRNWLLLAEQGETAFDNMYASVIAYGIEEATRAVELLSSSRYQAISEQEKSWSGFCHHDYAHHNVLITTEREVAIIDFDYSISDIRAHDLASLILRNMKSEKWDGRTAFFILKSYFERATPHPGEERLLHAMLRFPQDLYEVARFRYVEQNRPPELLESRLRKWAEHKDRRERFFQEFEAGARYVLEQGQIR
ncbi:CotS family spore coat protein [Tumebacillus permanentifrigoris]|uniref:CotS family spore coat protein n=1 Tax=Tumebacillus permanentifrigoris TaxID=378543 RepID=A0A316DZ67_9BACL|nr:CotS family spore coat protein [Tumebacillus permanentifrigoris]PWK15800.1 CotS family spore coat protein [Tumebacillus permanentifrigoris]